MIDDLNTEKALQPQTNKIDLVISDISIRYQWFDLLVMIEEFLKPKSSS
jgi:hypothetical protein